MNLVGLSGTIGISGFYGVSGTIDTSGTMGHIGVSGTIGFSGTFRKKLNTNVYICPYIQELIIVNDNDKSNKMTNRRTRFSYSCGINVSTNKMQGFPKDTICRYFHSKTIESKRFIFDEYSINSFSDECLSIYNKEFLKRKELNGFKNRCKKEFRTLWEEIRAIRTLFK